LPFHPTLSTIRTRYNLLNKRLTKLLSKRVGLIHSICVAEITISWCGQGLDLLRAEDVGPLDVLISSVPGGDGIEERWGIWKLGVVREQKKEECQEKEKALVGVDEEVRMLFREIVDLEDMLKLEDVLWQRK
jgi:hypothetical protein